MTQARRERVVIAGGGTAGWIAAAALVKQLGPLVHVTLVESDEIGTIGVGEATIPTHKSFHALIGLDEATFMAASQATFKLGIAFEGWGRQGDRYVHPFGQYGKSPWITHFTDVWLEGRARGVAGPFGAYCAEHQAAEAGRFDARPEAGLNYAYHLDATRYARVLRAHAEAAGAVRVEGRIEDVALAADSGDIEALVLSDGRRIEGDLFLDCTGFRALLIGKSLGVGYEDWRRWLPTDRALAVQTTATEAPRPYTRAIAHGAGWRWKIPLQRRVGNGLVYQSDHLSDDEAHHRLLASVDGEALTDPRPIRYVTGRRAEVWSRNCVALGLSSGFVEPLESTSIHLIQIGITRLLKLFPFGGSTEALRTRYNGFARNELERVRDFIVLHYKQTARSDTDFWRDRAAMETPDSLAERMEAFARNAHIYQLPDDLFQPDSWAAVMMGQGIVPRAHHRFAAMMGDEQLKGALSGLAARVEAQVGRLPTHEAFLASYCPADA